MCPEIPIAELRERFEYDRATNKLTWKPAFRQCAKPAGFPRRDGYRYIQIDKKRYLEHRVVWAMHYGEWPKGMLDHANCDRSDNRIENLRLATAAQNIWNRPLQCNNSTGYRGVSATPGGRFAARIVVCGVMHNIGTFDTPEAAGAAYAAAAREHHGPFAYQSKEAA